MFASPASAALNDCHLAHADSEAIVLNLVAYQLRQAVDVSLFLRFELFPKLS
jgi:hypothetical protein